MGSSTSRQNNYVTVPTFEKLVMNWEIRNFRKILEDSTSPRLVQEVSMEFEAGRSVRITKTNFRFFIIPLSSNPYVIVILFAYVIVELLKPKVDCPSKWRIALEKSDPDSLNLVLQHIQSKRSTKTVAVDVNVSFVKVDGSAPALSRSEI
jgi:hypothetical protein